MATPMTATQIVAQLKKWNVRYKEYKDWSTHNRGNRGTGWGPVNGFVWHHTGSDGSDQRELLYKGLSNLPGPLSHFGIAQDGTVWLIGWGRANHAGLGDPDVLNAVIDENYGAHPPTDNQATVDGNSRFYGVEIWYSGSHGMTKAQYESALRLSAAILDFHGWTEKSVIAHGEWQPGKWDPGYAPGRMMDMAAVRSDVKMKLSGGNSEGVKVPEKPQVYKDVLETDVAEPPAGHATTENPKWWAINIIRGAYSHAEAAKEKAEENNAILRKIADKLGVEL
jgi:hypothetical protein